jgi:hypothetical protein
MDRSVVLLYVTRRLSRLSLISRTQYTGVVLALVLGRHVAFTSGYFWPRTPVNAICLPACS